MAKCSKSNCNKPVTKDGLCADHNRLKQQELQKQALQKKQMEDSLKQTEEKRKAAAAQQLKNQQFADGKAKKIKEIAVLWNGQVRAVVKQVKDLRAEYPERTGINAGENGDLGTIPGGTNNPVKFVVPSNNYKIAASEVFHAMSGF